MTLVVLDVQDRYLADLIENDRTRVVSEVTREITRAREQGDGIILSEMNAKEKGGICQFVLDLIEDYDRHLRFDKSGPDAGLEVFSIIRQQGYDEKPIRLCGLYGDEAVRMTAQTILHNTNYQAVIEVAWNACGCVNYLFSEKDCLKWAVETHVEIV